MCAPRVADEVILSALRRSADFVFEFEQNKIVKILFVQFISRAQASRAAADNRNFDRFPNYFRELRSFDFRAKYDRR